MSQSNLPQIIDPDIINERNYPTLREGYLSRSDVQDALKMLGYPLAGYEFRELIETLPASVENVPVATFTELLGKVREIKDVGRTFQKTKILKEPIDAKEVKKDDAKSEETKHTVCDSEERGFSDWINRVLQNDAICKPYLPIKHDELYSKLEDGVLLCKLINTAVVDTIDNRTLNTGASLKSIFKRNENLSLAVNSAEAIGCCIVNIGPEDISKKTKHLVLGLIWQVIRIGLLGLINLNHHAELVALLREDETIEDLMQLTPEELLIRWVNYQLEKAGISRRINNFREDIQDSEVYSYLVNQIAPGDIREKMEEPAVILKYSDNLQRANLMLNNAALLDARAFVEPIDIAHVTQKGQNREKLNLAFVANLFNCYPALVVDPEFHARVETLEEKTYRNWMNSMGVSPYVKDIYSDLRNGLVLLQLMDVLKPGVVDWSKVVRVFDPKKKIFQMLGNCTHVIDCAKKLPMVLVNISGNDIQTAQPNLVLGLCFQMLRFYTMKLLDSICPGRKDDKDIVNWANNRTRDANKTCQITSFKDPTIGTSRPVLDLIDSIVPRSVGYDLLTGEPLADAKFAISQARKIGARIYALPQHLADVNAKFVLTIYACLMVLDHQIKK